jgi:hypothetical protein
MGLPGQRIYQEHTLVYDLTEEQLKKASRGGKRHDFREKRMIHSKFQETGARSILSRKQKELLSRRISDLSLAIQGTRLETLIAELYRELEAAAISFKPKCYLADEWGCPQGVPVIGIPFYLANPELSTVEDILSGIEPENDEEVMMCLRHESGHAFNYAFRLYRKLEWRQIFGKFSQPYQEDYKPVPFNASFVRHLPGWYAQKHPDEDFAETFAVWLTPGSNWAIRYAENPALSKLKYVDKLVRQYGRKPPIVNEEKLDNPVQELTMTLDSWYETGHDPRHTVFNFKRTLDNDLQSLFPALHGRPAADFLRTNERRLIREVNHWTGMNRQLLKTLTDELLDRVQFLDLKIEPKQNLTQMIGAAVFLSTLAMNYLHSGRCVDT